jgi:hypothetical protein
MWSQQAGERDDPSHVCARLVFDSSLDNAMGTRASNGPSQALYEAENYSIDLHLSRAHSARMILLGQIADRMAPYSRLAKQPVSLEADGASEKSSACNQLGEFYFEYDAGKPMRLRIPVDKNRSIEVPLPAIDP